MKYTVQKPSVTIDDAFYKSCNKDGLLATHVLADLDPAPEEMVTAAKDRLLSLCHPHASFGNLSAEGNPIDDWSRARAALSSQINWYAQQANTTITRVCDFFDTNTSITALFPAYIESEIQAGLIANGLVPQLIMGTETATSDKVTALYDSTAEEQRQLRRISEGAELPKITLTTADSIIYLYKYGRQIQCSYEAMANQRVDAYGAHLRKIAAQVAVDETNEALSVLVGGDGTTMGAAESNSTDQDVATSGSIAYSDLISWYFGLSQPYQLDKAVFGKTDLALIANLAEFKDASYSRFPDQLAVPGPKAIQYLWWQGGVTGSSYADRLGVGIDSRNALRKYTYFGSGGTGGLLTEQDKIITRQVNVTTFSYWCGFRKWDKDAVHVLDCAAAL